MNTGNVGLSEQKIDLSKRDMGHMAVVVRSKLAVCSQSFPIYKRLNIHPCLKSLEFLKLVCILVRVFIAAMKHHDQKAS